MGILRSEEIQGILDLYGQIFFLFATLLVVNPATLCSRTFRFTDQECKRSRVYSDIHLHWSSMIPRSAIVKEEETFLPHIVTLKTLVGKQGGTWQMVTLFRANGICSLKLRGIENVLVFRGCVEDLWGKKNMRVKGTANINRQTINSWVSRVYILRLPADTTFEWNTTRRLQRRGS